MTLARAQAGETMQAGGWGWASLLAGKQQLCLGLACVQMPGITCLHPGPSSQVQPLPSGERKRCLSLRCEPHLQAHSCLSQAG